MILQVRPCFFVRDPVVSGDLIRGSRLTFNLFDLVGRYLQSGVVPLWYPCRSRIDAIGKLGPVWFGGMDFFSEEKGGDISEKGPGTLKLI